MCKHCTYESPRQDTLILPLQRVHKSKDIKHGSTNRSTWECTGSHGQLSREVSPSNDEYHLNTKFRIISASYVPPPAKKDPPLNKLMEMGERSPKEVRVMLEDTANPTVTDSKAASTQIQCVSPKYYALSPHGQWLHLYPNQSSWPQCTLFVIRNWPVVNPVYRGRLFTRALLVDNTWAVNMI